MSVKVTEKWVILHCFAQGNFLNSSNVVTNFSEFRHVVAKFMVMYHEVENN